jgi:hypothetical protein
MYISENIYEYTVQHLVFFNIYIISSGVFVIFF